MSFNDDSELNYETAMNFYSVVMVMNCDYSKPFEDNFPSLKQDYDIMKAMKFKTSSDEIHSYLKMLSHDGLLYKYSSLKKRGHSEFVIDIIEDNWPEIKAEYELTKALT